MWVGAKEMGESLLQRKFFQGSGAKEKSCVKTFKTKDAWKFLNNSFKKEGQSTSSTVSVRRSSNWQERKEAEFEGRAVQRWAATG